MSEDHAPDEQTLAQQIVDRGKACDIDLDTDRALALARHMGRVMNAESSLHLTSIKTADEFLERHIGESFEGAAVLDRDTEGWLLDLGSGNGYPGLPVAACCAELKPLLAEVSVRKADFLRSVTEELFPGGRVIDRQIQRAEDLGDEPEITVIVTRAMGNWERVLPRLASRVSPEGSVLVWAGEQMEAVAGRKAWQRYRLQGRRALPGRERSWVWHFSLSKS
jgi:16S rRNA G527 N7-methylase RsmG